MFCTETGACVYVGPKSSPSEASEVPSFLLSAREPGKPSFRCVFLVHLNNRTYVSLSAYAVGDEPHVTAEQPLNQHHPSPQLSSPVYDGNAVSQVPAACS